MVLGEVRLISKLVLKAAFLSKILSHFQMTFLDLNTLSEFTVIFFRSRVGRQTVQSGCDQIPNRILETASQSRNGMGKFWDGCLVSVFNICGFNLLETYILFVA